MNLLTGKTGTPHVTSQQMRQVYEGCFGEESYILKTDEMLEPVLVSNNLLKIRSGVLVHHGNISVVGIGTADEVVLKNGAQGVKRIDLVVSRYKKNAETEIEECDWVLIQGIPDATNPKVPAYTVGNMQTGSLVDDCAAIRIDYDGIQVTSVTKLLPVLEGNIATLNSNLTFELGSNINGHYKKYTNGLLEQWGNKYVGDYRNANIIAGAIIFPISFIDANYVVNISKNGMGNQSDTVGASVCVEDKGIGGFSAYLQRESGGFKNGYGSTCGWCANGRWK